jgi:hypothetical protein
LIAGNLAFKNSTLAAANKFGETTAIQWITDNSASLDTSNAAQGYSKMLPWGVDATGNCVDSTSPACTSSAKINWNNDNCGSCVGNGTCAICLSASPESNTDGYKSKFMIARLRDSNDLKPSAPPKPTGSECQRAGEVQYGSSCGSGNENVEFFRIFVKTIGPRNTVVYTEQYVYF